MSSHGSHEITSEKKPTAAAHVEEHVHAAAVKVGHGETKVAGAKEKEVFNVSFPFCPGFFWYLLLTRDLGRAVCRHPGVQHQPKEQGVSPPVLLVLSGLLCAPFSGPSDI